MPTTPNPTPPSGETPTSGEPGPSLPIIPGPVVVNRPSMSPNTVKSTKSKLSYIGEYEHSSAFVSPFTGQKGHSFEDRVMLFDDICPGHWSFVQPSAQAAWSLPTGTGYYESPGNPSLVWSTNFKTSRDEPAKFSDEPGGYYSRTTTQAGTNFLMGVVTVNQEDVWLHWGPTWGVVSGNVLYDRPVIENGVTVRYAPLDYPIPMLDPSNVDVTNLEREVMRNAPENGAFVYLDLNTKRFAYGAVDGDPDMYPKRSDGTRRTREDEYFDESPVPLSSRLAAMPLFSSGNFQMRVVSGRPTYYQRFLTAKPQRTSKWLKFNPAGVDMDWGGDNIADNDPDQVRAQSYSNAAVLVGFRGNFITKNTDGPLRSISIGEPVDVYGSWLAVGANTQRVGWIGNGSFLGVTDWGMTSLSPAASVNGSSTFDPTTSDVQNQILDNIPGSAEIGFIFDASVGYFGRVFWISML